MKTMPCQSRRKKRPAVPLVYALLGHPKSGNVWEEHAESILAKLGWRKVADWTGVFVHADVSVICLYVYDFMMVATEEFEKRHWAEIGKHIEFKEDAALCWRGIWGPITMLPDKSVCQ